MKKLTQRIATVLFAVAVAACGGGGGSPGATSGSGGNGGGTGGTGGTPTGTPTLTFALVDASDTAITSHTVTSGVATFAKATVTDKTGAVVANKLVSFSSGSGLVVFSPSSGQVLTDSTGVARVQVAPASLTTTGAESLSVGTTVDGTALTASMDIQTTPANVTLSNMVAAQTSLTAFQSTGVTVDVAVNGQAATGTPVSVTFSASCGTFSPATTNSNSSSKAVSTYQPTGCSGGTATLTATAVGATAAQTTVTVQTPTATNLLFVSATPSTIFTSVAAFGVKQSTVKFKVVDASGAAITTPTDVRVSLSTSAIAAGVTFGDTNSTAPKTVSTDTNGEVSVIVAAGAVPTPLALTAVLVSNPVITASSAGLSVNSGRPSQAFFSLSLSSQNISGWEYDGESTTLTVLLADRLGQPVPAGTPVSFVTEGGQVTASCQVTIDSAGKSGCTVSLISQEFRPTDPSLGVGRVTVLAYAEGEEVFVDANGNNKYDAGETFYDMGQPFLDINEDGTRQATEQKIGDPSVPGSGIGTQACTANSFLIANVANTCDGVWGPIRVRQQAVIAFSSEHAGATTLTASGMTVSFTLADINGNAMPKGTTISATVTGGTGCGLDQIFPSTVGSTPNPTTHVILLQASGAAATCSGAKVAVKATSPKGLQNLLGTATMP
ncbi:hypothetical protein [Ramlibacter sp. PS4R-6]|uniref:hypothetical protein n=1 Tax=Ramlibacter sp. PS4R-6 TaxID=3133438 RepID=UPI0030A29E9D